MLLKCCTKYASKFGKLSSGHRTGKGQFSFQSQRREMPKNVQTTTQLHPFHWLARSCSKFFKLGFNSKWTENFQMYKLDLETAEEPKIKLPTSAGSNKKWDFQKNIHFCFTDYTTLFYWLHLWPCGSQQTVDNSSGDGNTRSPYLPLDKLVYRTRSNS